MVVKMRKWSPWPTISTRKFKVKVKLVKLEFNGWNEEGRGGVEKKENVMAVKLKWKGEPKFGLAVPFRRTSKRRTDFSTEKKVVKRGGEVVLELNDEFENVCSFSIVSSNDQKFGPWEISFSIIGEKMESKAKLEVIGRASLNIAEMVSMMESDVERKLPLNLHFGGVSIESNLLVLLNFVEIRDSKDTEGISQNSVHSTGEASEEGEVKLDGNLGGPFTIDNENGTATASETGLSNEMGLSMSSEKEIESVKKVGFFSWKRRRLRFSPTLLKGGGPLDKNTGGCIIDDNNNNNGADIDLQSSISSMVDSVTMATGCGWESKEFISRDGETKVKTDVFFASFDQCSNKAAGESACTALVAVIAHWLQLNPDAMPTRSEFDNLIVQGSQEWRKLCEIDAYMNNFPNKHFDLETVVGAGIRPISISYNDSFVGFFSPEKFESLKGAMSFDEIWDDINNKTIAGEHADDDDVVEQQQRIYIVSWNDHFFVLKVDADACYIIDTLGARLYEGCNQAYILRFDKSSLMYGKNTTEEAAEEEDDEETNQNYNDDDDDDDEQDEQQIKKMICRGKNCCKEFMKRFLAAIPLQELEAEEKKGGSVSSYYSLHHRLQIELNFSYLLSSSSLSSSPFSSSSSNCESSCSTDESCNI